MEHHALAVDDEGTVIADAYFTEADLRTSDVAYMAGIVLQCQHKVV